MGQQEDRWTKRLRWFIGCLPRFTRYHDSAWEWRVSQCHAPITILASEPGGTIKLGLQAQPGDRICWHTLASVEELIDRLVDLLPDHKHLCFMKNVLIEDIKRVGPTMIICGNGYTATEGMDYDGVETLVIKKDGRFWAEFRGSSLCFATPLSVDDKATIASLINYERVGALRYR